MDNETENQRRLYAELIAVAEKLNQHIDNHGDFWQYCTLCGKILPKADFYKQKSDATRSRCRHCFRERQKAMAQTKERKDTVRKYREEHGHTPEYRERNRAGERVRYLVKKGKIPPARELSCTNCGKPADHYHHHNGYAEQHLTDVVPLCALCHKSVHTS